MTLYEKIKTLYPQLTDAECFGQNKKFSLRNDGDARGDYIENWSHPTLAKPTDAELAAIQ